MGFSPGDCEALLSLAKGLSYQIGIKYGYWLTCANFFSTSVK